MKIQQELNKENSPVNFATPLKLMSSIITGSERPFAFTAKSTNRYELDDSRLSTKNDTGGLCMELKLFQIKFLLQNLETHIKRQISDESKCGNLNHFEEKHLR